MSYLFFVLNVIIGIGLLSLAYAYYRSFQKVERLMKTRFKLGPTARTTSILRS